ncbi:hypothetical protein [Stutzerimonas decontaminans]|uniref:Uncharacterized protein n=1 Tax=Stutzerimonas stutzeri TaxID=316 RepID=A0A023WYW2_STUST|nr:hypothetical protein [Stutzerimonas decontaminans]AHY45273.1 hypothetical protein UIB01_22820 [Stutzerimonas decontaminans]
MINLSLELTRIEANGPVYRPHTELVENLSGERFESAKAKCEVDGWVIHSWSASEQLPFDEGYTAAAAGIGSDANPYAEHFWKHNEWWLGWDSHQETNS